MPFDSNTLWLALAVLLFIIEALVPGLVSIWFALGAAAALLVSLTGAPLWLQGLCFVLVSAVLFALTRPLAKKFVNSRVQPTNADMVIGKDAIVTEEIDNIRGCGAVNAGGKIWSARSEEADITVPVSAAVTVIRIEGVKLIVRMK